MKTSFFSLSLALLVSMVSAFTTTFEDINRVANIWVPILEKEGVSKSDDLDEYIDTFSPSLIKQFDEIVERATKMSSENDLEALINSLPTNDEFEEVIDNLLYVEEDDRRRLMMRSVVRAVIGRQPRQVYRPHITASNFVEHSAATTIQRNLWKMMHNRLAATLNRGGAIGRNARDLYRRDCIELLENMGFKNFIKSRVAAAARGMGTIVTNVGNGAVELSHAAAHTATGVAKLTEFGAWVLSNKTRTGLTLAILLVVAGGGVGAGYGIVASK